MGRRHPFWWCLWLLAAGCFLPAFGQTTNRLSATLPAVAGQEREPPAVGALAAKVRELWRKQHELEYADPELARLRKEIAEHERRMVQLRQELAQKLADKPEIQELERQRKDLVRQMQQASATSPATGGDVKQAPGPVDSQR